MPRKTLEWIGKTDNTKPPARVKLRIFEKHNGRDYETGQKIRPGDKWEADHVIALINGGENRESNLAPLLVATHKQKTKRDMKTKSKIARIRAKHIGIAKPKTPKSRFKKGFDGIVRDRETGEPVNL